MTDRVPGLTNPALDLQYFWGSTVLNGNSTTNNGNLANLQIATQTGSGNSVVTFYQSYAYDSLNRLSTAGDNGGTGWSEQFGYDRYGNMWLPSASGLPAQPLMPSAQSVFNAATNQISATGYDAAGNQTAFGGYTIGYDAENRQISAQSTASPTVTYTYDGTNQRVMKSVAGGARTVYVHDVFGNLAAEYSSQTPASTPCTTCYLSWDHLGTRMVTDESGNVVARHDYLPFGGEIPSGYAGRTNIWGVTDNLNPKFTGQERDAETGLDFFQARYHASAQGRFLSADPIGNFAGFQRRLSGFRRAGTFLFSGPCANGSIGNYDPSPSAPPVLNGPDPNSPAVEGNTVNAQSPSWLDTFFSPSGLGNLLTAGWDFIANSQLPLTGSFGVGLPPTGNSVGPQISVAYIPKTHRLCISGGSTLPHRVRALLMQTSAF